MNAPNRKTTRTRFQMSLRSFLIVVAITSAGIGLFNRILDRARNQREVVEWLTKKGGKVTYDFHAVNPGIFRKVKPDAVPQSLVDWLGVDFFSNVSSVTIPLSTISNDLPRLAVLKNLKSLNLSEKQSTPWEHFMESRVSTQKQAPSLDSHIATCDLSPLSALTELESLYLDRTTPTDFSPLSKLSNLDSLYLRDTSVAQLSDFKKLTNLRILDVRDTKVPTLDIDLLSQLIPGLHILKGTSR